MSNRASSMNRRRFLAGTAALGCSAAASPLLTPVALASAPWDNRLVVIILRGGMDGLDVVQPHGDRDFQALRSGRLVMPEADRSRLDLDGFFTLHPALAPLMPWWQAGELSFAHAVSTPYRDRRSHFDGQDLLEAGTGYAPNAPLARDGWLNRLLQVTPGIGVETAFALGRENPLILQGDAPVSNWVPGTRFSLSPQARRLLELVYAEDPLFQSAVLEAVELTEAIDAAKLAQEAEEQSMSMGEQAEPSMMGTMGAERPELSGAHVRLAEFAAERLREETRIAAFSLGGWDTHRNQPINLGRVLGRLSDTLQALRIGLGSDWAKTTVVAMTEFGRTVRQNGTNGTDHGTGGAMLMAGGAIKGGQVHTHWPGLAETDLYGRRDLMPTEDVRSYAAAAMQGLFGLDRHVLETAVFPGLDMGNVPRVIL